MVALRARSLSKSFDGNQAVDGVDLEIGAGAVWGLLGPNGAGKTTLLRMLFGLIRPDDGEIELLGRAPAGGDAATPLEGVAGFVEDPTFYPYLSGRANLALLAELDGGAGRAQVDDALERVDLTRAARTRVGAYSTGMRQRLGIAAALLRRPKLLLLDEPTSGLDPAGARAVGLLLRELAAGGVAVLLSSHLIGEVETMCDGFTVLHRGRVVWTGTAAALSEQAPGSAYALSTSDDARARSIADEHPGTRPGRLENGGLAITVESGSLDSYVLTLGRAGVAVRRLELVVSPLESMFFALTGDADVDPLEPTVLAAQAVAPT